MDQMVSWLSVSAQVSFIKTGTYKGIRQVLIGVQIVICRKLHFEFFQASSGEVGQNIEATITSFKIAR